jgi:uncharacterized protein YbjT (DUF2867 family)
MYVVTGATGNTGSVIAKALLAQGKRVRVFGRSGERLAPLVSLGAQPIVGDITDRDSLAQAFVGSQAVYAMVPPDLADPDFPAYQDKVTDAIAYAIEKSAIQHVVVLSSFGADKPANTGPIAGLHRLEERLKQVSGLNALFLRAGYFMENTLAQTGIIRQMGATAGPLRPDLKVPMIATRDIGAVAAEALLRLDFQGYQTRELQGERDLTMTEVTAIIAQAIGKPGLEYRQVPDEQFHAALLQMGFSRSVADLFIEMSQALNSGHVRALEPRSPSNTTPTSYEQFVADVFLPLYRGASAVA